MVARQRGRSRGHDRGARVAARRRHRWRRDHADLRRRRPRRRATSSISATRGCGCSRTRSARPTASASASTWPPARAGRSADRGSADDESARSIALRTWTVEGAAASPNRIRFEQPALLRAIGMPAPNAPTPAIEDLKDPVDANANLQALAIEQVRFRSRCRCSRWWPTRRWRDPIDLTDARRRRRHARLDRAGRTLDAPRPVPRLARQDGRARRAGRRRAWSSITSRATRSATTSRDSTRVCRRPRHGRPRLLQRLLRSGRRAGAGDGTPALLAEFQRRRGYDLATAPAGAVRAARRPTNRAARPRRLPARRSRICCSRRSPREWSAWARTSTAAVTRNQAHGSPGEPSRSLRRQRHPRDRGRPHHRGSSGRRPRRTSRAGRWSPPKRPRGSTSTSAPRSPTCAAAVDIFFVAGVNHIVYHGTAYSPAADAVARLAVLRVGRVQRAQPAVEPLPRAERLRRALPVVPPGRARRITTCWCTTRSTIAGRAAAAGRLAHFGNANQPAEGTAFEAAATRAAAARIHPRLHLGSASWRRRVSGRAARHGRRRNLQGPGRAGEPIHSARNVRRICARAGRRVVVAYKGLPADVSGLADLERRSASPRFATACPSASRRRPPQPCIGSGRMPRWSRCCRAGRGRARNAGGPRPRVRAAHRGDRPFYFLRNPTDRG